MAEFPNRIRELRSARGWSQDKLAAEVGCSKPQISDLERGNVHLTVEWMRKIAWALEAAPADMLNLEDNPMMLSPSEQDLIERLRAATPEQHDTFERVAAAVIPLHTDREEQAA